MLWLYEFYKHSHNEYIRISHLIWLTYNTSRMRITNASNTKIRLHRVGTQI